MLGVGRESWIIAPAGEQGFVRTQVLEKAYHLNGVDYDDWIYRLERESHPAPADAG